MAIDKAVDSAVLEAGLTIIANAIREKGGTSDTLAFPDAMAEAIAAIEAVGGDSIVAVSGTFTPTEDLTSAYTITFDEQLAVRPKLIVCHSCNYTDSTTNYPDCYGFQLLIGYVHGTYNRVCGALAYSGKASGWYAEALRGNSSAYASTKSLKLDPYSVNSNALFLAGEEYRWLLFF